MKQHLGNPIAIRLPQRLPPLRIGQGDIEIDDAQREGGNQQPGQQDNG